MFVWIIYRAHPGAVIANVLAVVSVGRVHGAATANFLGDVLVDRLHCGATANFLADVSVGHSSF